MPSSVAETREIIAARSSFNTTTYFYLGGRGDLWSPALKQKLLCVIQRANAVRPYGRDRCFFFGLQTEVHFLTVMTIITSQSAYADSSPQGEPLSIITFENSRKQFFALSVEIRSRYFGYRPNKDLDVALHNPKSKKHAVGCLSACFYIAIKLNSEREYRYRLQHPKLS